MIETVEPMVIIKNQYNFYRHPVYPVLSILFTLLLQCFSQTTLHCLLPLSVCKACPKNELRKGRKKLNVFYQSQEVVKIFTNLIQNFNINKKKFQKIFYTNCINSHAGTRVTIILWWWWDTPGLVSNRHFSPETSEEHHSVYIGDMFKLS